MLADDNCDSARIFEVPTLTLESCDAVKGTPSAGILEVEHKLLSCVLVRMRPNTRSYVRPSSIALQSSLVQLG
jgi:hypothetical protein